MYHIMTLFIVYDYGSYLRAEVLLCSGMWIPCYTYVNKRAELNSANFVQTFFDEMC